MMAAAISPLTAATQAFSAFSSLTGAGAQSTGQASALSPALAPGAGAAPSPFADLMTDAIGQVNQLEQQANSAVSGLMTGSGVDVHQAMIATQKESMAFDLALAVRNKAVAAYQQVIGMQF
jgi:flagellar hook-basal body complex protein FliE